MEKKKKIQKEFQENIEYVKSVSGGRGAGAIKDRCCFHLFKHFSPGGELE